jgi:hypothetical protein
MKKTSLFLVIIMLITSGTFAASHDKGITISRKHLGRECCTASGTTSKGVSVSVEICKGWLLSNSENSKAEACKAAQSAVKAQ